MELLTIRTHSSARSDPSTGGPHGGGCRSRVGVLAAGYAPLRRHTGAGREPVDRTGRRPWRMPPLDTAMAVLKV
ncbi:hypothetical protein SO3561_08643 [Streptomyces olivochromogenes]|uniref:Uncharacterized protein n=1 Tax=Streptomyces olivochromogenes TaxID=1963 RepID=A0A250VS84_STROL|nr:hypothetical protein SO3561_08643 [Streptomyces olivochromogenes]